ncbi:MAG TPA: helix-turn-helix domain-containing protein, partial [Acidimicrobiia bacterium]|nr:helix-turn-helix domain-containing protein [Acidimicrobiia bacterium]
IIDAALRVAKRVGFDKLTMRALADELGVTPMAAYYYVKSKDQLLELVADSVAAAQPTLPPGLSWDEQLKLQAFDLFDRLTEYPGLGAFLLERPLTPAVRENYPTGIGLFRRAGLDEHEAELAQATYHTFMFGVMGMEYRFRSTKRQKYGKRDHDAVVVHASTHEFIEFGLDTLIEGIRARARATGASS